jgi:hypothetical protein
LERNFHGTFGVVQEQRDAVDYQDVRVALRWNADLPTLQWAHQHGLPIASDPSTITAAVRGLFYSFRAVEKDKLDIVEWLREDMGCDWDEDTCYMAARKCHEDILEYLWENECPWDERCGYTKCRDWALANGVEDAKKMCGPPDYFIEHETDSESSGGKDNPYPSGCQCRGCRRGFDCGRN